MYADLMIPSFDPKASSSHKKYTSPQSLNLTSVDRDEYQNTQAYGDNITMHIEKAQKVNKRLFQQQSSSQQFWQTLELQQFSRYKTLIAKHQILEQSIRLHHEGLKLRNSQHVDCGERISQLNVRIKQLTKTCSQYEQKIIAVSLKCQQTNQQIDSIRNTTHKQQSMIVEQGRHIEQIQNKISRARSQIQQLQKELRSIADKQKQYEQLASENERLIQQLDRSRSEASYAKIKVDKNLNEEQYILRKMKQLQTIIRNKQKGNRQLGRKLLDLRKTHPQAVISIHKQKSSEKVSKLQQMSRNIRQMHLQNDKVLRQLFQVTQKIQNLSQKAQAKRSSIQLLKMKKNIQAQYHLKQQNSSPKQRNKVLQSGDESYELKKNQVNTQNATQLNINNQIKMPKKPIGYRVIQSEQNENFIFPRKTLEKSELQQSQSFKKSEQKSELNRPNFSERSNKSEDNRSQTDNRSKINHLQEEQDKQLQVTQSLKKLLSKFEKIKSNSVFKH